MTQTSSSAGPSIPATWTLKRLGDVCDILDGQRVPVNAKERAMRAGSVPYYGATGQVGWIDDHLFDEDLVLLGEDGAPFLDPTRPKAYRVSGQSWVNNHAHVLRARNGLLNAFLLYQLNHVDYSPYVTGTTRLKLPQGAMRRIPLVVPPVGEQRSIVAAIEEHLSHLDAAVAGLERTRLNYRRYRSAALRSAADGSLFGAVQRSVRGPDPWSPAVPSHWRFETVANLAERVEYGTSAKTQPHPSGVPVLRMGNIVDGDLSWEDLKSLPATHNEFPGLLLAPGDILFNRTNSPELVGKTAVYNATHRPASFASYLLRVRLRPGLLPEFFSAYVNSMYGRAWVASVVTQQVGQANVNGTKLRALAVPVPPLEEQERIIAELHARIDAARRGIAGVEIQLARAARLRQSILKCAFEGTLTLGTRAGHDVAAQPPASVLIQATSRELLTHAATLS